MINNINYYTYKECIYIILSNGEIGDTVGVYIDKCPKLYNDLYDL